MLAKMHVASKNVFVIVLTFSISVVGQDSRRSSHKRTPRDVPVVSLKFEQDKTSPMPPATPVMGYPMRCGADGTAYLEMLQPPNYLEERRLLSVSAKEVHEFVLRTITDLSHVQAIDYFPSGSELALLVKGARDSEEITRTFVLPNGEKQEEKWPKSEVYDYIARFDLAGKYPGVTQLDSEIAPWKLAMFPSGNFLIWGQDRLTKAPRLRLARSSGEILRYVEMPARFTKGTERRVKLHGGV